MVKESVPELVKAFRLGTESEKFIEAAASLAVAQTTQETEIAYDKVFQEITIIKETINGMMLSPEKKNSIGSGLGAAEVLIPELMQYANESISLNETIELKLKEIEAIRDELISTASPIFG